ncbi:MAG: response regulator [Limisphaerales bacterium]
MITILALDDDPNDLYFLKRALDRSGIPCNVISAHNGLEAQDVLKTMDQSAGTQELVIFSDVDMPRQNGLEFLKWLKGEPHFHSLPVVMLSSFDNSRDINRALEFGASACMIKPPEPNAVKGLLQTIRTGNSCE